ncbi:MAG: hypothetical protein ACFCBW_20420, partial [Candidatus Competibacterales bacterium]
KPLAADAPTVMLPANGPMALLPQGVAYVNDDRLFTLTWPRRQRRCLRRTGRGLEALDLDDRRLMLSDRQTHQMFLDTGNPRVWVNPSYAFGPRAALLDAAHATSGGLNQERVLLQSDDGQRRREWHLDGPVVQLVRASGGALALSFDLDRHHHRLWYLPFAGDRHQRPLPPTTRAVTLLPHGALWLDAAGQLWGCRRDLTPHPVATLPPATCHLHMSLDGRLLVSAEVKDEAVVFTASVPGETRRIAGPTPGSAHPPQAPELPLSLSVGG